jgi:hypothetical protein
MKRRAFINAINKTGLLLFFTITINYVNGQTIIKQFGYCPPPPVNYQPPIEEPSNNDSTIYLNVPAYIWSYGNDYTCIAMLAAYYDREGYPCIYTGSLNGGLAPLHNNSWTKDSISITHNPNGYYYYKNSISASIKSFGEIITNKNNQGKFYNDSTYYSCNDDGSKLYDYPVGENLPYPIKSEDIIHKFRLFLEEGTGYTVNNLYTQLIQGYKGNDLGFSFINFINEIDQKRPVLIHFNDLTAIGIGYNEKDSTLVIYDTWSTSKTKVKWGNPLVRNGVVHEMQSITVLELLGNYQLSKGELLKSTCNKHTGPFDYVTIKSPPLYTRLSSELPTIPTNTYQFSIGEQVSFYATFSSYFSNTKPAKWNWEIELYYKGGVYHYIQDNYIVNDMNSHWSVKVPSLLPNYDWIVENGAISGKVTVLVSINGNNLTTDEVRVGVINNCQNFKSLTRIMPNNKL